MRVRFVQCPASSIGHTLTGAVAPFREDASAAAPLIIVGTTVVGIAATKADWPQFAAALAVVIGGALAAFSGPSGAWLVAGIGLFVGLVVYAVARALLQHR